MTFRAVLVAGALVGVVPAFAASTGGGEDKEEEPKDGGGFVNPEELQLTFLEQESIELKIGVYQSEIAPQVVTVQGAPVGWIKTGNLCAHVSAEEVPLQLVLVTQDEAHAAYVLAVMCSDLPILPSWRGHASPINYTTQQGQLVYANHSATIIP